MTPSPQVGDIITIGKSKVELVVVRAEVISEEDSLRGDCYFVTEFDTIPLGFSDWLFSDHRIDIARGEEGKKSYYFTDGSTSGEGKGIKREMVNIVGSCKVKKVVTVEYSLSKGKHK